MKKLACFVLLFFILIHSAIAQAPDDIIKYSYFPQHGSARSMAIGGAMGSLGGDLSAMYVNPAGLGLFKTSEVVISPAFQFNNNKAAFRGTGTTAKKSAFDLGLTGAVFGTNGKYSRNKSEAFAIGVNQIANFNNFISYRGQNDNSSYSEQFTEEISRSQVEFPDGVLHELAYAFGSSLAVDTYLVDTVTQNNNLVIKGAPEYLLENGTLLNQQKDITTSGGIYEFALAYAANTNDKFYYGITLGIPVVTYKRTTTIRESDASNDPNNGFAFSEYTDQLKTNGYGLNAKLGFMFKPTDFVRLGFAIHTPTYYALTDEESASMVTDLDGLTHEATSSMYIDGGIGSTDYITYTPWKFIASGSYIFREAEDVHQQRGFITADAEYVTYPSSSYRSNSDLVDANDDNYYSTLKSVIKDYYKGAFNFRVGGELKFNTLAVRLGGAYYGNPYSDKELSSSITQLSGGLGYRNKGIFIDLTYVQFINKDVNFPYRLQDKANTFATYKNNRGNALLTVGFKL